MFINFCLDFFWNEYLCTSFNSLQLSLSPDVVTSKEFYFRANCNCVCLDPPSKHTILES